MSSELRAYAVEVLGHLDQHWAVPLGATDLVHTDAGTTRFRTGAVDQAHLHGVLGRLRDIGVPIHSLAAVVTAPEPALPAQVLSAAVRTPRLVLRPAVPDDAEVTWPYRRLPEVAEWLTDLQADAEHYRRTFTEADRLAATVIVELEGVVVGDFMLHVQDGWAQADVRERARGVEAELGWTLDPAHTGQGYASEAVAALIDHCFGTLGVRRVVATCFADNQASVRLAERLGMRRELHAVADALHRSGRWLDTYGYALLAEEWAAVGAPPE